MISKKNMLLGLLLFFSLAFNLAFALAFTGIYTYHRTSDESHYERRREGQRSLRGRERPTQKGWHNRLDLTKEQRQEFDSKRRILRQKMKEEHERAREMRERFLSLLEDPDAENEEIARAAEEFHQVRHRIQGMIFDDLLELRRMLDDEQRRELGRSLMRRYSPPATDDNEGGPFE